MFLSGLYGDINSNLPVAFTSPGLDIYLFSLVKRTSKKSRNSQVNFTIFGLEIPLGLTHTSTRWKSQTLSRNVISVLDKGQSVNIQYIGMPECCLGNLWGGFSVSGYMDPLVAFSVARSTSMTSLGVITYDTVIVNTGQFKVDNSTFVAHMDGIYYFSISAGLFAHTIAELMLKVNGVDIHVLYRRSTTHNGTTTISSTTLLDLQTGDNVTLHLTNGSIYSSVNQHEVSLMCFLYSLNDTNSVAWLVSKSSDTRNTPILYDTAHIMNGVEFRNSEITIAVSGLYYIYYSLIVRSCGYNERYRDVSLKVGLYDRRDFYFYHTGSDATTVSGSYVFKLSAGDKLTVRKFSGCRLDFGDLFRSTAFMGFLIEETYE